MALKQDFSEQVKRQIEVWQAQIKEYQAHLGEAGAKARSDYESGIAQLRSNADEAGQLLQQVQRANEAAWKDMQTASQKAFEQLQKGWSDALSRFM
ncbi:MAG TPA: hypothetical protein VKE26_17795 [Xanthobacteraceae bacterium]|nr:hypothetical protein [Xanthobacteraceae bacterium]